jgi:hypothetical protein
MHTPCGIATLAFIASVLCTSCCVTAAGISSDEEKVTAGSDATDGHANLDTGVQPGLALLACLPVFLTN